MHPPTASSADFPSFPPLKPLNTLLGSMWLVARFPSDGDTGLAASSEAVLPNPFGLDQSQKPSRASKASQGERGGSLSPFRGPVDI